MRGFRNVEGLESSQALEGDELSAAKVRFAEALLIHPDDTFKAALSVFPSDFGLASKVANQWVFDPEVLTAKNHLIETKGEESFLPTKTAFLHLLWARMSNEPDTHAFVKVADVYAKTRNFYPKEPAVSINNNNVQPTTITNRIMKVTVSQSDEEWAERARLQQQNLILNASEL